MKTPFSENEATWNVSASGVNWQTPGANGENDRELTPIGSTAVLDDEATGTEKIIPLDASKMQELANGTFANNGFFLKTDAELNDAFFYKSSDSSAVTQRPKLVIEYTLSDSTPAPTFTPTL
ncbi:MAG: hypothetical protein IT311_08665, partial [Anaerolineales bacterium]|nr:hypothetical protein [Anaerolineales bacterium]